VRIGELAARAGVSVRALRYYEEQGLLPARRSPRGQRLYTEAAVDRVRLIRKLYAAGLSSRTAAELLPCCTTPKSRARLRAERARLDARIAELTTARAHLDEILAYPAGPATR